MIQDIQTVQRLPRRRQVNQRKQNSSDNLQHQQDKGCTSKRVPPTRRLIRGRMQSHLLNRRTELKTAVEPVVKGL